MMSCKVSAIAWGLTQLLRGETKFILRSFINPEVPDLCVCQKTPANDLISVLNFLNFVCTVHEMYYSVSKFYV